MKTPREILFARHQATAPKLDALRREVVAGLNPHDAKAQSWSTTLAAWCLGGHGEWVALACVALTAIMALKVIVYLPRFHT